MVRDRFMQVYFDSLDTKSYFYFRHFFLLLDLAASCKYPLILDTKSPAVLFR